MRATAAVAATATGAGASSAIWASRRRTPAAVRPAEAVLEASGPRPQCRRMCSVTPTLAPVEKNVLAGTTTR